MVATTLISDAISEVLQTRPYTSACRVTRSFCTSSLACMQVSFTEYRLFYRALLQKRPVIWPAHRLAGSPVVSIAPLQGVLYCWVTSTSYTLQPSNSIVGSPIVSINYGRPTLKAQPVEGPSTDYKAPLQGGLVSCRGALYRGALCVRVQDQSTAVEPI